MWTIPKDRMKANKEHIVPLSDRSIAILKESQKYYPNAKYIFPSDINLDQPLSKNTMLFAIQKRMNANATTNGMRTSFKV